LLETKKCILEKLRPEDFEDVKQLYRNETVRKYLGGIVSEESYKERFAEMMELSTDNYYWVVRDKKTNSFMGIVSLDEHHDAVSTEISYQLLPEWWGSGCATEVLGEILNYAFTKLMLTEIVAETQTANRASCKLLERVGMVLKDTTLRFGTEQVIYCKKQIQGLS
jgi:[ribosomal protein S5]-alanine N-acetyltransferase